VLKIIITCDMKK